MPINYRNVDTVKQVLERTKDKRPTEATVHGIDGDRLDLRIDDSVAVVRHVQVVGDVGAVDIGDTVQIKWSQEGRPIALLPGYGGSGGSTIAAVDNDTLENSSAGLRVKPGGIEQHHLAFSLKGFVDIFADAGWQIDPDTGSIFHTNISITPTGDISLGSGEDVVKMSALGTEDDPASPEDDSEYRIWVGRQAPFRAPFRVKKDGSLITTKGTIGGWNALSPRLYSDAGNAVLHSGARPFIGMGTEDYGGTGFWAGKDTDYVYKVSIGESGGPQLTFDGADLTLQDIDLKFYSGTNFTLWIQSDGDFAIGGDIDTVSGTSMRIFSNDQTYNGEAFTAGDIVFGDHDGAHMLWDQSSGQLQFRDGASTGTPTEVYIDTDGTLTAGDGYLLINLSGISLQGYSQPIAIEGFGYAAGSSYKFHDASDEIYMTLWADNSTSNREGFLQMNHDSAPPRLHIRSVYDGAATGSSGSYIEIAAYEFESAPLTYNSSFIKIGSQSNSLYPGEIRIGAYSSLMLSGGEGNVIINDGWLELEELATGGLPATGEPGTGYGAVYAKASDGKLYFKNDGGTEYDLTQSGGAGYWSRDTSGFIYPTTSSDRMLLGDTTFGSDAFVEIELPAIGTYVVPRGLYFDGDYDLSENESSAYNFHIRARLNDSSYNITSGLYNLYLDGGALNASGTMTAFYNMYSWINSAAAGIGSAYDIYISEPSSGVNVHRGIYIEDDDNSTTWTAVEIQGGDVYFNKGYSTDSDFIVYGASAIEHLKVDTNLGVVVVDPWLELPELGTGEPPATGEPGTGFGAIYAKTDGKLYFKNDGGTEYDLTDTDHGSLSGLSDDDHTQYFLLAGETTNAELHSGAGLSVYSDAGSTLVASIDTTGLGKFNSVSTDSIYHVGGNLTISTVSSGSINIQPVSGITNITGNLVATGDLEATDIDLEDSTQPWMNILVTGDTTYGRVGRALSGDRLDFWQNLDYVGASYTPDDATAGSAMIVLYDDAGVGKISMYAQDAQTGPVSITNAFEITESEIVFSEAPSADINVRMESVNLDDVFFMDSGTDQIYLGGQSGLDSSFMLGMQALDVSGTGREILQTTGLAIGNLEGSGDAHMYLQYLDYDYTASGTWLADFAIMGINQYYDESSDAWAQADGTYPGVVFELYTTKHTSKYPNFALFYSPAGSPATQYNWFSGNAGIADSGVVFNDNGIDLNLRVEGDSDPNLFFVDGGTGQVMIGNTAANASPPSGGTIDASMERLWVVNEDDYAGISMASIRDDATAPINSLTGYGARGTLASPSATQNDDYLLLLSARGHGSASWQTTSALMAMQATEAYDTSGHGADITFELKLTGTVSRVEVLHLGDEIVFNEDGSDIDQRFEGDTVDDLLFINAGEDTVYIGGQSGGPNDDSAHLVLQARDPVQSLTDYETGIMLGELESAGEGTALQYLDYNAGSSFQAYFGILSTNVYWDASTDQWEFFNNQKGGVIFQLFQRYDTSNDASNFGIGYYKENIGGSPTTFVNWISATSYNTSSGNDELIINDNNEDMDVIFRGDTEDHVLFIRGSDGNIGIGHSAPYYTLVVGDGSSPYTDPVIGIRSGTSNLGTLAFGDADSGDARYAGYVEYSHSTGDLTLGAENGVDVNGHMITGSGTSFPGSPAADDHYYRTDYDMWFFYDGTRWLSVQEYHTDTAGTANSSPYSLAHHGRLRELGAGIYATRFEISTSVATTNDGSNYWTIRAKFYNASRGTNTNATATIDTSGDSAGGWNEHAHDINEAFTTNYHWADTYFVSTGSPGDGSAYGTIYYRVIAT